MKSIFLKVLVVLTLSTAAAPALARNHPLSATSNALPLLETVPVYGEITHIDGRRVQIQQFNGEVGIYHISKSRQQRYGLSIGSDVTLGVRRLNNAVITINES